MRGRRLRAVRVSRGVCAQLGLRSTAVVVGVQHRACHLALDSGPLLLLSTPDVPLAPNGVRLDLAPAVTLAEVGVRVGQTVMLASGARGEATDDSRGLADRGDADWLVALAGVPIWEPRPRVRPMALGDLDARLAITRAIALADGAAESLLPLLWPLLWASEADPGVLPSGMVRLALEPARRLSEAAARGDAEQVAGAAGRLAGLGPGLTPSGDDFLAGFAAAWTLVGQSLGCDGAGRRRVTHALVSGARAGASLLGRAWIEHAVRGELPEPMTRFAAALFAAEARDLGPAARTMLAVGASSGTDWTVGFLLGAAALAG